MKTWFDIEPHIENIEALDKETLESFANVLPPPSQNPAFHHKFDHTKERILRRLSQIDAIENSAPQPPAKQSNYIHDIGVGTTIVVIGACAIWVISHYFGISL